MYELLKGRWPTPHGNSVMVNYRADTIEWNVATSSLTEDEYGLRDLYLSGLALDIGGYLGTIAMAMAIDNPGLQVICVEPVPENAELIRLNLEENQLTDRITLVEGLAGHSGTGLIRYGFPDQNPENAFMGNSSIAEPKERHTALPRTSYSLSDLTTQAVSFMKIDCEGGEYAFLDTPDVARVERIHGEWHHLDGRGGQDRILAMLAATHDVTFSGPAQGPGGFQARRRDA